MSQRFQLVQVRPFCSTPAKSRRAKPLAVPKSLGFYESVTAAEAAFGKGFADICCEIRPVNA